MKHIKSFEGFSSVNEAETPVRTVKKVVKVTFDIDWNENIGKVEDEFMLAFSSDSTGVFSLGSDVEKYCGIPEEEVKRDVAAGKENPEDAIIYGLCNIMNGGADIYFWNNGNRLGGAAQQNGIWPAVIEQISHECNHLTRLILTRAIAKNKGIDISKGEWITYDYGSGEYFWPASGDVDDKKNPLVLIDEEAHATALGIVAQTVTPHFLEMASTYIPQLASASKI
jgi:hypothetical protein